MEPLMSCSFLLKENDAHNSLKQTESVIGVPCSLPSHSSCRHPMSEFEEWASRWTETTGFSHRENTENNGDQVNEGQNWTVRPAVREAAGNRSKGKSRMQHSAIYVNVMATLEKPFSGYSLLYEQHSCLNSTMPGKGLSATKSKGFVSNVKTLTRTGLLDGVPVEYVSASGKLPGIIRGASYICGCQSCNYTKEVNAYEFERHAGCKRNHPNNHIQFPSGRSIFQVVQMLNKTALEEENPVSFETIQAFIGFPINEQAYSAWIESFRNPKRGNGEIREHDSIVSQTEFHDQELCPSSQLGGQ